MKKSPYQGQKSVTQCWETSLYLPVKVGICGDKSPEENVVELDVAVVGLVLHRALHPVDELVLARDVHGGGDQEVFLLPGWRGLCSLSVSETLKGDRLTCRDPTLPQVACLGKRQKGENSRSGPAGLLPLCLLYTQDM